MFPILILLSLIMTVVSYWMYKHPSAAAHTSSSNEFDEVVSLDDDMPASGRRKAYKETTPVPFLFCLVLTNVLILGYFLFGRPKDVHDENITYEELAVQEMGKRVAASVQRESVNALLIVPADTGNSQYTISLVKSLKKGHGYRVEIIGEESPISILSTSKITIPGYINQSITASELNGIADQYPGADMIISLVGLSDNVAEIAKSPFPRKKFIAVFVEEARLYHYLNLIHAGVVNLAVISRGTHIPNTLVPKKIALEDLLDRHFLFVNQQNVQQVTAEYRQYIGRFPIDEDPVFGQ